MSKTPFQLGRAACFTDNDSPFETGSDDDKRFWEGWWHRYNDPDGGDIVLTLERKTPNE